MKRIGKDKSYLEGRLAEVSATQGEGRLPN